MAKKVAYDETSVVRSLSKKSSIQINTTEKIIRIVDGNTEVGNGSWGKIDLLKILVVNLRLINLLMMKIERLTVKQLSVKLNLIWLQWQNLL